jgi:hypothetical protein
MEVRGFAAGGSAWCAIVRDRAMVLGMLLAGLPQIDQL